MLDIKLVRIRHPETLDYLNHDGLFVKDYAPADCIFILRREDGHVTLQHEFYRTFFHACGSLKEKLDEQTGKFQYINCPDSLLNYVQYTDTSARNVSNEKQMDLPDIKLVVEETDETPVEMMPIGNYQVLTDDQVKELEQLANGGQPLGRFGSDQSAADKDMAEMIRWLGEIPKDDQQHYWINGIMKDGTEIRICKRGGASITVLQQQKLSRAAEKAWLDAKMNNPDEDYSKAVEAVIKFTSGGRTFWQNVIFFGENYLVGEAIWALSKAVTKILTKGIAELCTYLVKRGVTRALTMAEARGLQAAMTQDIWYVKFTSWMSSGSRGARFLAGASNFIITLVIFFIISYFVFPFIFKKQRASVYLYNFSDIKVRVSTPYLGNIPINIQESSANVPYLLPGVTEVGTWVTVDGLEFEVTSKVVHGVAFGFENDSTFMEGFEALLMMEKNSNSNTPLFASIDVPWVAGNTINLLAGKQSDSYKDIFKKMADTSGKEKLNYAKDGVAADIGINALKGEDNRYTVQINIKEI